MGDPKKLRKKYKSPKKLWDKIRIVSENELIEKYGLRNKKEIWGLRTVLGKKRASARALLAARPEALEQGKKVLIGSLERLGILSLDANVDAVLGLQVEDFLERRLQTIVYRKGLANTIKQARQFIVHGFIAIDSKRVRSPGFVVTKVDEKNIKYFNNQKPKILDALKMDAPDLQKEAANEQTVKATEKEVKEEVGA